MLTIEEMRADLTDYGKRAVVYWMEKTGCSELTALRHVTGGPRMFQPGHKLGSGWH